MTISGIGATPEPQKNDTSISKKTNQGTNQSIFSKYDSDKDGKVNANEQRIALTNYVAKLYHNLKKNMNMRAINLITKFSKTFKDIEIKGDKQNIKNVDIQIDNMLNKRGNDIINLIENGNDRTNDFKSHKEFFESKDLKEGDYCVSKKGYIYQYNGKNKNWSLYDGSVLNQ